MYNKYKFINKEGSNKIVHFVDDGDTATDVVRHFFYFLQGCSFARISIANAFRNVAEEMEPEEYEQDTDSGSAV